MPIRGVAGGEGPAYVGRRQAAEHMRIAGDVFLVVITDEIVFWEASEGKKRARDEHDQDDQHRAFYAPSIHRKADYPAPARRIQLQFMAFILFLLRHRSHTSDMSSLVDPKRTIAELKELRSFTADENGAQRVAFTKKWV